jgi:Family of unknown function (DUF6221)
VTAVPDLAARLRRQVEARLYLARNTVELGNAAEWTELSSGVLMTIAPDAPQDNWDGVWPMGDSSLTRLMEANDPRDTIARCEAELAILDLHKPVWTDFIDSDGQDRTSLDCDECDTGGSADNWPCRTVRLLGSGYRHRPGYLEEWTP